MTLPFRMNFKSHLKESCSHSVLLFTGNNAKLGLNEQHTIIRQRGMSTCLLVLQCWLQSVNMNGSFLLSLFRLKGELERSALTDMVNHAGLWLEKNETEIAIKGTHANNGLKPVICYQGNRWTRLLKCRAKIIYCLRRWKGQFYSASEKKKNECFPL